LGTYTSKASLLCVADGWSGSAQIAEIASGTTVNDGNWHHVVIERYADMTGTIQLFLDGVSQGTATNAGCAGTITPNLVAIGSDLNWLESNYDPNAGGSYFAGSIDEVAVWNRVLSSTEVSQLYRRGANRIKYQVKTCTAVDCSDNPTWTGPDGTNQTYFSELNNNVVQNDGGDLTSSDAVQNTAAKMLFANFPSLALASHRYFQYRAMFASDSASSTLVPSVQSMAGSPHYSALAPTIFATAGTSFTKLTSFSAVLGGNGCSAGMGFVLSNDGSTWQYYTAGAWSASNSSYAQSSTASTINTNTSTFPKGSGTVYVKAILNSNGNTACEIDSITIGGQQ
jgi:hypothetical protein